MKSKHTLEEVGSGQDESTLAQAGALEKNVNCKRCIIDSASKSVRSFVAAKRSPKQAAGPVITQETDINAALADLSVALLSPSSIDEISSLVLKQAMSLTNSILGYVGCIDDQTGYLVCSAVTEDIREVPAQDKNAAFEQFASLCGWVLDNRKPLITNAPAANHILPGISAARLFISRFLSVPVLFEGMLVSQVGLANAGRDYRLQDMELIERLALLYAVAVHRKRSELTLQEREKQLEQALRERERELWQVTGKLEKTIDQIIKSLSSLAEMRDLYTAGHQPRVAELASAIAAELGMDKPGIGTIRKAALIHDIGKSVIPPEILNKPGVLNDLERSFVKTHAQASYEVLKTIDFDCPVAEIVHQHHERMDRSGYPQGLPGEKILLEAKILAVADVVESMASHRPYRPAFPLEQAIAEIKNNRGILYDPEVVDACLKVFEKGFCLG